jgi:hypothetical protein
LLATTIDPTAKSVERMVRKRIGRKAGTVTV